MLTGNISLFIYLFFPKILFICSVGVHVDFNDQYGVLLFAL